MIGSEWKAQGPSEASSTLSAQISVSPPSSCYKPGGIVSALRVSRRDEGESARDLCLSLEPGQNKKQGEGIGPQQTAVLASGKLVAWKLNQWCKCFLGRDPNRGRGRANFPRPSVYVKTLYVRFLCTARSLLLLFCRRQCRGSETAHKWPAIQLSGRAGLGPRSVGHRGLWSNSYSIIFLFFKLGPRKSSTRPCSTCPHQPSSGSCSVGRMDSCVRSLPVIRFGSLGKHFWPWRPTILQSRLWILI